MRLGTKSFEKFQEVKSILQDQDEFSLFRLYHITSILKFSVYQDIISKLDTWFIAQFLASIFMDQYVSVFHLTRFWQGFWA